MQQFNWLYTLKFSAIVCFVCSLLVSSAAVVLRERQETNALLDKQRSVLKAAGLVQPGEKVADEKVRELFGQIESLVIDLETGEPTDIDPDEFDMQKAMNDPGMSQPAPPNKAQVPRLPDKAQIYEVLDDEGRVEMVILPIEGKGLWSTMRGFIALDSDLNTIRGITYYSHGETPGLGGEVDNPRWQKLWDGRKAYGEDWEPKVEVVKGSAGPPEEAPYKVDGLSGATITSRGVTHMLDLWLGENGFAPFLKHLKQKRS